MVKGYRCISLPGPMVDECERLIKHPVLKSLGFSSHTSFIKDAVQDKIKEYQKKINRLGEE